MYVKCPERRYCDVKSEREIFYLRNVVVVIIVLASGREMYCLRFLCKMALINHVEWIKTCVLRVNFH